MRYVSCLPDKHKYVHYPNVYSDVLTKRFEEPVHLHHQSVCYPKICLAVTDICSTESEWKSVWKSVKIWLFLRYLRTILTFLGHFGPHQAIFDKFMWILAYFCQNLLIFPPFFVENPFDFPIDFPFNFPFRFRICLLNRQIQGVDGRALSQSKMLYLCKSSQ